MKKLLFVLLMLAMMVGIVPAAAQNDGCYAQFTEVEVAIEREYRALEMAKIILLEVEEDTRENLQVSEDIIQQIDGRLNTLDVPRLCTDAAYNSWAMLNNYNIAFAALKQAPSEDPAYWKMYVVLTYMSGAREDAIALAQEKGLLENASTITQNPHLIVASWIGAEYSIADAIIITDEFATEEDTLWVHWNKAKWFWRLGEAEKALAEYQAYEAEGSEDFWLKMEVNLSAGNGAIVIEGITPIIDAGIYKLGPLQSEEAKEQAQLKTMIYALQLRANAYTYLGEAEKADEDRYHASQLALLLEGYTFLPYWQMMRKFLTLEEMKVMFLGVGENKHLPLAGEPNAADFNFLIQFTLFAQASGDPAMRRLALLELERFTQVDLIPND